MYASKSIAALLELPFGFVYDAPGCEYQQTYSIVIDGVDVTGNLPVWLTLDSGTTTSAPKLVVDTLDVAYNKKYYQIEVGSTLNTFAQNFASQTFELEIDIERCLGTKLIDAPLPGLEYLIYDSAYPATEHTFAEFLDTLGDCGARKYTIESAAVADFVTFDPS